MLFSKKKPEPEPQAPVTEVPEVKEPEEKAPEKILPLRRTTIGRGITFYGNFETEDPMEINGSVMGDIHSSALIRVTEGASLKGDADMKDLDSQGRIDGNLVVSERSSFSPTAVTDGTLLTRYLKTEDGSEFLGELKLSGNGRTEAAQPAGTADAPAEGFSPEPAAEEAKEEEEFSWNGPGKEDEE